MSKKKKKKAPVKSSGLSPAAITAIGITVVVVLAGIGAGVLIFSMSNDDGGDGGSTKLPDFVYAATAPKDAPKAYQFALDSPEYLAQVPCYCGCVADGHRSNLDCFIQSRDGDDVEFDRHGAG